jgi:transcriptional regulator with XRE-family HTH domain
MPTERRDPLLAAEFGRRVRAAREATGMSQEALSEAVGVHRTLIGTIERGEVGPTLTTIVRIAEGLSVDPADLVRGLVTTAPQRPLRRRRPA